MAKDSIIFISCGQGVEKTLGRQMAAAVDELTEHEGYFAENVSSAKALSSNILEALNRCAGFVAVMHHRGTVQTPNGPHIRASVWIEQEIAIVAFLQQALGRELAVKAYVQKGIKREGVRDQLQLNPTEFSEDNDVLQDFRAWLASGSVRGLRSRGEINAAIRPNLQVEINSGYNQQNNTAWLEGKVRNKGNGVASEVRLAMMGLEGQETFQAIAPGDEPKRFAFRLDNQQAHTIHPQFAGVRVEYLDDDGIKYEQQGWLDIHGPDNAGRLTYSIEGLGRPKQIAKFTLRFHPLEDL